MTGRAAMVIGTSLERHDEGEGEDFWMSALAASQIKSLRFAT
jgi:hypothetical protein